MDKHRRIFLIGLWIVAVLCLRTPYRWQNLHFSIFNPHKSTPHKSTMAADGDHQLTCLKLKKHRHKIKTQRRYCALPSIEIERVIVRIDETPIIIEPPSSGLAIPHKSRAPPKAS